MDICNRRTTIDTRRTTKDEELLLKSTYNQPTMYSFACVLIVWVLMTISSPLFSQSVPEEDSKSITADQAKELIVRYRYDRFENTGS
ncbi:MAG: hypothetical protein GF372_07365, partial [Candidatus Marinimicrobia bacterium]|nr:hypothetical protein [Candidatus Neomarinimicrobiota bacterium]